MVGLLLLPRERATGVATCFLAISSSRAEKGGILPVLIIPARVSTDRSESGEIPHVHSPWTKLIFGRTLVSHRGAHRAAMPVRRKRTSNNKSLTVNALGITAAMSDER